MLINRQFNTTHKFENRKGGMPVNEREVLLKTPMQVIGEEGCGVACEEATVFGDV
jgi:hypothetical protein